MTSAAPWIERPARERGLSLPVGETRERGAILDLLATAGTELALQLRDGRVVFARTVEGGRVRPWGAVGAVRVEPRDVRTACVVTRMRWSELQRITRAQRDGHRLVVGRGRRLEVRP